MIGIYKITNQINGKCYIGQSVDIDRRLKEHFMPSKYNNPSRIEYNYAINIAIRKYGIKNFTLEIIEQCSEDQLDEKECYWINYYDSYNNGYNSTLGGRKGPHSPKPQIYQYDIQGNFIAEYKDGYEAAYKNNFSYENIRKVIDTKRKNGRYATFNNYQWLTTKYEKITDAYNGNPIIVFNFEGKKIGFYESTELAAKEMNEQEATIRKSCIHHNTTGRYAQYRYWRENPNLEQIPPKQNNNNGKAVNQYDLNGNYVTTFKSITAAAKTLQIDENGISACCNHSSYQKSAGNFLWTFYGEDALKPYIAKNSNGMVIQYDLNNNYIAQFKSATAAGKALGNIEYRKKITKCCKKEVTSAYNYIWRYANEEEQR